MLNHTLRAFTAFARVKLLAFLISSWSNTASALSIPFSCRTLCALESFCFFCFFWIPALARLARTVGRWEVGDSARGADVKERSTSKLGEAALRAARVFAFADMVLAT